MESPLGYRIRIPTALLVQASTTAAVLNIMLSLYYAITVITGTTQEISLKRTLPHHHMHDALSKENEGE
jgi:hypothetical protein